ncbi:MAG: tryptophanase [Chitinophagaceae bacterium]|nr:tryptophanase [Chitinophagaceae bacterium]
MFKTIIEPFKIKSVEPIYMTTEEQRKKLIKEAHYNPFLLHSRDVIIDMLTDSGTSAMSSQQWAGIMQGDESYAGASSFLKLEKEIQDLTGYPHVLPTHQGRAAERILYSYLGGKGKIFISNTHFDTTRANIEFSGAEAIDIPTPAAKDHDSEFHFKGNIDLEKLEEYLKTSAKQIGAVIQTVTNNSGGGQPVSMENTKQASALCKKYGVLFVIDCCRIAENSYFIRHYEKGYENYSYRDIAKEMFSLADGGVMSAKKDALVNIGGFLALKDQVLAEACTNLLIITEGFVTYGGLAGRDMEAMAIGLREVFEDDYLTYRITSTKYLGEHIRKAGIPVIYPIGGHAVYVDAGLMYPHIPANQYPGQTLVCELYKVGGIRAVEIGSVMFGKYDEKGELIPAPVELVRLAIPRRVYTQSHIDYVIEVFEHLKDNVKSAKGMKIVKEPKFLRHFTAHFEEVS